MKVDDILALIGAGYTKEEIRQMEDTGIFSHNAGPAEMPLTEPEAEPAENVPTADPEPSRMAGADLAAAFDAAINRMNSAFDERIKQIQSANVQAVRLPEDKPKTADDVIAQIIAPPVMGKRKREE